MQSLLSVFQEFTSVSTDSRKVIEDSIFFCLRGGNFNGNAFAREALNKGAARVVMDDPAFFFEDERVIKTDDSLKALQELAKAYRQNLTIPIISITGSNGKTTTKELISSVLNSTYSTYATKGNLNNHIGVPLSLLEINDSHEFAIIEMGANHQQEISFLTSIAQPDYGLITNIGLAHLEGFGGEEGVYIGKKELFDHVSSKGKRFFYNTDDAKIMRFYDKERSAMRYGTSGDISGKVVSSSPMLTITVSDGIETMNIDTNLTGAYNLPNILAAIAVGRYFDVPMEAACLAIQDYTPSNHRSQVINGRNTIVVDAYNANISSMRAALHSFANNGLREKMVILGAMKELGEQTRDCHKEIVELCSELSLEAKFVGSEYLEFASKEHYFGTTEEVKEWIQKDPPSGRSILLKGSRSIGLEVLIPLLD